MCAIIWLSNKTKNNTQETFIMVQVASIFSQLLSLISRNDFAKSVRLHCAEKGSKGFSCWDQFVSMLFCQFAGANSLREICGGLATTLGRLRHLGMFKAPGRTTLAYANKHRPWEVFQDVFYATLEKARAAARLQGRRFRFKNPLVSIDSSTIHLCREMYDWAKYGRSKGAVKLHLMLDHQGHLPSWAYITEGKVHDVKPVKSLRLQPGTIVAMDRGYNDYKLFGQWTEWDVFFVTRMKRNCQYDVVEYRTVPKNNNILSDQIIELTSIKGMKQCPHYLRRVEVYDLEKDEIIVLLTNIMHLAASTIGNIYKERWQIELFFKALKQHLKIKTFVGTSENAVKIQIWTALIAMLILKLMQLKSVFKWSLSNLAAMIRINLLIYRDLWKWLDEPYKFTGSKPPSESMPLFRQNLRQQNGGNLKSAMR